MRVFFFSSLAACSLFYTLPRLQAKDPMQGAKKEADKFIKEKLVSLQNQLTGKQRFEFSDQDLLPDADKDKTFDAIAADMSFEQATEVSESSELNEFLKKTKRREQIEDREKFIVQAETITQNPHEAADIASLSTSIVPEEERLQSCREGGSYQVSFIQKLSVQAAPEVKQSSKHCQGHEKERSFFWKSDAEDYKKSKKKKLSKNPEIVSYEIDLPKGNLFKNYVVVSEWQHCDNATSCAEFRIEEKIIQEAFEEDFWQVNDSESLALVESNPFCKLLYTQVTQGPDTRLINGKSVFRDIWGRQLYFSCEPEKESKCATLRQKGGILIHKKCLEENALGECNLWEKVYDLGKKAAFQKPQASFKDKEIWGLNGAFETSYDKSTDFGSAFTTLSVFSDLEKNLEEKESDFHEEVEIFKGEKFSCQKSFAEGNIFDCCKKMKGMAVNVKLAHCNSEEKCLAEKRYEGKCRSIGTQKVKLGTITEHVYCCFPTKLARIVQEEGRKQLGLKWGSAGSPKCHGFTLKELQLIDFSQMDFSEVVDDIKIDKQGYEKRLKGSIDSLQKKVQADVQQKRLSEKHVQTEDQVHADR